MPSYTSGDWFFNVNDVFLVSNGEKFESVSLTLRQAGWQLLGKNTGSVAIPAVTPVTAAQWNTVANAWEWYRDPASGRDLTLQRGATARSAKMYLGQRGIPFTGGDTTNPPSAATQFQVIGTGDFFDTTWWNSTVAGETIDIGAKSTSTGPHGAVFPFWMRARAIGSSSGSSMMVSSVWSPAGASDSEPWVNCQSLQGISSSVRMWYLAGLVGEDRDFTAVGAPVSDWSGMNPYNNRDDLSPVFFRQTFSSSLQRKGQMLDFLASDPIRAFGDTVDLAGPVAYFNHAANFSGAMTPWPVGVAPTGL